VKPKVLIWRLLSGRDRLSRPEKDEILERILARVDRRGRRARRIGLAVGLAGAAAAIALMLARTDQDGGDEIAARGPDSAVAALAVGCDPGEPAICDRGDRLVFDLDGTAGFRHFAAFARGPGGVVIWYVDGAEIGDSVRDGVLDRAVELGDHGPGEYRVYGVFSLEPLGREAIRDRFVDGAADLGPGTRVITRELVVR
jgi:hypothetical protein